jgi:hypothetical protein
MCKLEHAQNMCVCVCVCVCVKHLLEWLVVWFWVLADSSITNIAVKLEYEWVLHCNISEELRFC